MTIHELKCWPEPFKAMLCGAKTAEFRRDDRGFKVGDTLRLNEFEQCVGLSGRSLERKITHILGAEFGVPEGFVMLSISCEKIMSTQQAIDKIIAIIAEYLPPDSGISEHEAMNRIIACVDPWPKAIISLRETFEKNYPAAKLVSEGPDKRTIDLWWEIYQNGARSVSTG